MIYYKNFDEKTYKRKVFPKVNIYAIFFIVIVSTFICKSY